MKGLVLLALLSLLATSEAVVSGRLDRRLRLVKKPLEASTEAEADSVQLDGTAFIELGDNVHEPRSIQAGTLVPGKDASLPAVDLSTQAAPAAASSTASATATAASSAASASEAKKQRMPGDSLPASLPPSALVDPEVQKKHAAEKAAKQLEKELASLEPDLGDEHDPRITRSKFDRRKYRTFVLPNGLRVLLVSDSKTSRAAVAMDVGQGHYGDPETAPGLAHFLEHMLFLGTKKYPSEDSYDTFLSTYGGSDNAYTDNENTNFYFDINAAQLHGALDRFSQFFIAPLLTEGATGREMKAVDAEHSKNKQNDEWRETQLLQSFGYEGHPFHKFGTGSLKTLGNVPHAEMRELLFKFYNHWYHASNMRLVVLGKEKLSVLEDWVRGFFADVPRSPEGWKHFAPELSDARPARWIRAHPSTRHNELMAKVNADAANKAPALHAANPLGVVAIDEFADSDMSFQKVFDPKHLGKIVYFRSVKDRRKLSLYWALPHTHYDEKSLDYICTLLSNQHKGSLYSYLKHKGWVLHMDAGVGIGNHEFDVIQITARLTESGLVRPAALLSAIYGYLRLMREKGVEEWRFNEMKKIAEIDFSMKSKERPIRYVSKLARDLREYRPFDILVGDYQYQHFNAAQIKALLNLLVPANAITMLSSGDMHRRMQLTQRERWYKAQYTQLPIDAKFKDAWTGPLPPLDAVVYPSAASASTPASTTPAPAPAAARFLESAPSESGVSANMPVVFDDEHSVHQMLDAAVMDSGADAALHSAQSEAESEHEMVEVETVEQEEDASFLEMEADAPTATPAPASAAASSAAADAVRAAALEKELKEVDALIKHAETQQKTNSALRDTLLSAAKAKAAGSAGAGAGAAPASTSAADAAKLEAVNKELAQIDADIKKMDAERAKLQAQTAAHNAAKQQNPSATTTPASGASGAAPAPTTPTAAAEPWVRTRPAVALNEADLETKYHEKLRLPPPNPFIPDDLSVHAVGAPLPLRDADLNRPDPYAPKKKSGLKGAVAALRADPSKRPIHNQQQEEQGQGQALVESGSLLGLEDLEHDPAPLPAVRDSSSAAAEGESETASGAAQELGAQKISKAERLRRKALLARLRKRLVPIERNTDQRRNPIIIHEQDKPRAMRVWFHQDRVFGRPRANLRCRLWSPLVYTNARTYTTAALWVLLLEDSLTEFSYQTGLAGFSYVLGAGVYGVDFGVSGYGYNNGYRDYVQRIVQAIARNGVAGNENEAAGAPPSAARLARFELVRTRLREQWVNSRFTAPHAYSKYVAEFVLHQPRYFTDQLAEELATLSFADVQAWHQSLFTDVALECLVHGNAAPRHAVTLIALLKSALPFKTISQPFALQYRGVRLVDRRMTKLPGQFTVSTVLPNAKDKNSALYNYYQFGQGTAESSLFANVLAMVAEKPAFHTLRTHEQLGYIVWALDDSRDGVQAFSIRIQSSTRSAEYLAARVRKFLGTVSAMARDLSRKQWNTLLKTLIAHKMKPALTLDEKTRKFWAHISNQRYRFDYYLTQVALLRRKLPRMKQYFTKYVDELLGFHQTQAVAKSGGKPPTGTTEADFRMLSVQVNPFGSFNKAQAPNHAPAPGANKIKVADLKKQIAEAQKNKKKKNKNKKKKSSAPRFAAASMEAVEWEEDRESGELDSDTENLTIDQGESDEVMALLTAAESEDGEAVDMEAAVQHLLSDSEEADEEEEAEELATPVHHAPSIAKPLALVEMATSVQAQAGTTMEVDDSAEVLSPAQLLGGDADSFAALASSLDMVELEANAEAQTEVDAEAEAETDSESAAAEITATDVSQLPVAVTLRRRGKKPRTVQLLMEHLKTVSDELPLYPMRGVGALPPIFDPNAGALLDDPKPVTSVDGKPATPPFPAEQPAATK